MSFDDLKGDKMSMTTVSSMDPVVTSTSVNHDPMKMTLTLNGLGDVSRTTLRNINQGCKTDKEERDVEHMRRLLLQSFDEAYHDDVTEKRYSRIMAAVDEKKDMSQLSITLDATDILSADEAIPHGEITIHDTESYMNSSKDERHAIRSLIIREREGLATSKAPESSSDVGNQSRRVPVGKVTADFLSLTKILSLTDKDAWKSLNRDTRESYITELRNVVKVLSEDNKAWGDEEHQDRLSFKRKEALEHARSFIGVPERIVHSIIDGTASPMMINFPRVYHLFYGSIK